MRADRNRAYAIAILFALTTGCGADHGPTGTGSGSGTVVLTVSSEPPGAEIFVDGTGAGSTTPDTLLIPAGTHAVTLRLCDYEEWTKTYDAVDGDTLVVEANLDKVFVFGDDFEAGAANWTAGCPFTFPRTGSHDGSAYALIVQEEDCSTRLIPGFEIPRCLTPRVSFYYKLTSTGLVAGNLRIDADGGSEFVSIDTTSVWTRFDVPASAFDDLTGQATFSFVLSANGIDTYRLSLDDFALDAE
jgi:hypothetical protein